MAGNTHDFGDLVRVYTERPFSDADTGVALDPDVVKISIRTPAGVTTTYVYGTDAEVIKDATGEYHMDVDADEYGKWYYRFWSTGNGQAAEERNFVVRQAQAV